MALSAIFCPKCDSLVLAADRCSNCDWRRLPATEGAGKLVWAVALEVKLPRKESHPVAAKGFVYLPTDNGQIVTLEAQATATEESVKWRYHLDRNYRCYSVAVWHDYLLIGVEYLGGFPVPPGELILLSGETGEEIGRLQVEGASLSVPTVSDDIAFFTVNTGWLYAVDLAKQQELWRKRIDDVWSWSPAAPLLTPDGQFVLPSRSDQLVSFDSEKSEIVWIFHSEGWFPQTPIWLDGVIYTRCWDGHLFALDANTGQKIWQYKAPRDFSSDFWMDENYLYVGVKDYQDGANSGPRAYALYVLNRQTGELVSRYGVPGRVLARPIAAGEMVFFATDDHSREVDSQGTLYALNLQNPQDPQLMWDPCMVEQRFQSDLLLVDNLLIAGTREGAVHAFCWRGEESITEPPAVYIERNEWNNAAIAYVGQQEYAQAAEIYANRLNQPSRAGQLYLHIGDYHQVIALLGKSEALAERTLAIKAAQALPEAKERADALYNLGDYRAAADAYKDAGDWVKAGDCYQEIQEWEEARAAYTYARAWDKWAKLTRDLKLWQDLIDRHLEVGEYAKAAEIYADELGRYLEAAKYFDQAGLHDKTLAAYCQIELSKMSPETRQRLAELAEESGKFEIALEAYQSIGPNRKVAEILEKLARHLEAANMFVQDRLYGRAGENLERQVDQEIQRLGGVRYARRNERIEEWLSKAIALFEDEDEVAETEDARSYFQHCARRCRNKLAQLKRQPLLKVSVYADRLVLGESSVIKCTIKNIGWGTARHLNLSVNSPHLQYPVADQSLGNLRRHETVTQACPVVPNIAGAIMFRVKLTGQTKSGELIEFPVEGGQNIIVDTQAKAEAKPIPALVELGHLWDESSAGSSGEVDSGVPVSQSELKRQKIESLRRQLNRHTSNLNKLREQAAIFGAGQTPLNLLNQIEAEENAIAAITENLSDLDVQETD